MNRTISDAQTFAHDAHASIVCPNTGLQGHRRKYAPFPRYTIHTDEVADIVASVTDDKPTIFAAHFHDILEDVFPVNSFYSLELIRDLFGAKAASLTFDLTDQYIKENYPQWNRKTRKQKERERLGLIAPEAQTIKLADLISNTSDIVRNDPNFAVTYLREKVALLPYLTQGDKTLWARASKLAAEGFRKLGID